MSRQNQLMLGVLAALIAIAFAVTRSPNKPTTDPHPTGRGEVVAETEARELREFGRRNGVFPATVEIADALSSRSIDVQRYLQPSDGAGVCMVLQLTDVFEKGGLTYARFESLGFTVFMLLSGEALDSAKRIPKSIGVGAECLVAGRITSVVPWGTSTGAESDGGNYWEVALHEPPDPDRSEILHQWVINGVCTALEELPNRAARIR